MNYFKDCLHKMLSRMQYTVKRLVARYLIVHKTIVTSPILFEPSSVTLAQHASRT